MTYNEIIKALPSLSGHDLRQIVAAIQPLLQIRSKDVTPHHIGITTGSSIRDADKAQRDQDMFLEIMMQVHPVPGFRHISQVHKLNGYGTFVQAAPDLIKLVDAASRDRLKRRVFINLIWRMLIGNIRDMGLPVGYGLLLRHSPRIPAVLDLHFPGYVQFGLLSLVLNRNVDHATQQ